MTRFHPHCIRLAAALMLLGAPASASAYYTCDFSISNCHIRDTDPPCDMTADCASAGPSTVCETYDDDAVGRCREPCASMFVATFAPRECPVLEAYPGGPRVAGVPRFAGEPLDPMSPANVTGMLFSDRDAAYGVCIFAGLNDVCFKETRSEFENAEVWKHCYLQTDGGPTGNFALGNCDLDDCPNGADPTPCGPDYTSASDCITPASDSCFTALSVFPDDASVPVGARDGGAPTRRDAGVGSMPGLDGSVPGGNSDTTYHGFGCGIARGARGRGGVALGLLVTALALARRRSRRHS